VEPLQNIARLSLNQMTTERWSIREAVDGCARAEIPAIGPVAAQSSRHRPEAQRPNRA